MLKELNHCEVSFGFWHTRSSKTSQIWQLLKDLRVEDWKYKQKPSEGKEEKIQSVERTMKQKVNKLPNSLDIGIIQKQILQIFTLRETQVATRRQEKTKRSTKIIKRDTIQQHPPNQKWMRSRNKIIPNLRPILINNHRRIKSNNPHPKLTPEPPQSTQIDQENITWKYKVDSKYYQDLKSKKPTD